MKDFGQVSLTITLNGKPVDCIAVPSEAFVSRSDYDKIVKELETESRSAGTLFEERNRLRNERDAIQWHIDKLKCERNTNRRMYEATLGELAAAKNELSLLRSAHDTVLREMGNLSPDQLQAERDRLANDLRFARGVIEDTQKEATARAKECESLRDKIRVRDLRISDLEGSLAGRADSEQRAINQRNVLLEKCDAMERTFHERDAEISRLRNDCKKNTKIIAKQAEDIAKRYSDAQVNSKTIDGLAIELGHRDRLIASMLAESGIKQDKRTRADMVREFNVAIGAPIRTKPVDYWESIDCWSGKKLGGLWCSNTKEVNDGVMLVVEEIFELFGAWCVNSNTKAFVESAKRIVVECLRSNGSVDLVALVDGAVDTAYTLDGLMQRLGVDMDRVFEMVHENNMTKPGGPKDPATGKQLKPEGYKPPDIMGEIERQARGEVAK